MRIAPDVLWVVLALPMLAALGLVPALMSRASHPVGQLLARHQRTRLLALALACGSLLNYALGMVLPSLRWALALDFAIAATSLTWALALHRRALQELLAIGWVRWLLAGGLLLAFSGMILFESIRDWDARSVWYFAAKRLFFGGGLGAGPADWTLPAYGFSHADYPKLLPLLAAQSAALWGVWNEFIPKAGLLLLLLPVLVGLLGLPKRLGLSLVFLLGVLLLSSKEYLWNGYADTYLCLYGVLSALYLARWIEDSEPMALALGSAFMGTAINLKNEGSLVALCIVAVLLAWLALSGSARERRKGWRHWPPGVWMALVLPWIGFAAWALTRHQWQLANDLQLGAGSVQRVLLRLAEGKLELVAGSLLWRTDTGYAAALLLASAGLAWGLRSRVPAAAWFPAAVATLYVSGMAVVYLATPHDVAWHLATSAERTMLVAAFGYLGSTFLVLEAMEVHVPATAERTDQTGLRT